MLPKSKRTASLLALALLCLLLMPINHLLSQSQQKIVGNDTSTGDYFGSSVSIDGSVLLVGAFYDDEPYSNSGAGFIFEDLGGSWSQQAKLASSDSAMDDGMGFDVSLSGNTAVLGAPWDDLSVSGSGPIYNTGSATIFTKSGNNWVEAQKIFASDAQLGDNLGWGVSIDGTRLVVGAPLADLSASSADTGAAYVFNYVSGSWVEQIKLMSPSPSISEGFGRSVTLLGNTLFIGAWRSDVAANDAGAVYVYQESGGSWSYQQTLTASDAVNGDGFGEYVAVDNDLLLVGSWLTDDNGSASGSAYIFKLIGSTWIEQAKLLAPDGASGDRMGFRLDIRNGVAAVGSRDDDHSGYFDAGSTYLFEEVNGSWQQLVKLVAADAQSGDNMGIGVAISSDTVASSAELTDQNGTDSGSVYLDDIPAAVPTSTPAPLSEALQIAPINSWPTGQLTYKWLEVEDATDYTMVVYDIAADTVVFSDTFASNICTAFTCSVQPQGLILPAGTYSWLLRALSATSSSPWSIYDSSFCGGLVQEAENGKLNNFFEAVTDANASGGQYIHVPEGTGNEWYGPVPGKQADFCFSVTTAGTYRIKGWVQGTDSSSDAFFVKVDQNPSDGNLWDVPISSSLTEDYVADRGIVDPLEVVLSAGMHYVSVYLREDGARLDKLELEFISSNLTAATVDSDKLISGNEISGVVRVDNLNGPSHLAGISVRLTDMFSRGLDFEEYAQTNSEGYYEFSTVPPGHYYIQIQPPQGYESNGPSAMNLEVSELSKIQVTFDLRLVVDNDAHEPSTVNPTVKTYLPAIR